MMVAKCPQCGRLPIQARNELTLLKLAEAGKLTCTCSWCAGLRWTDVHFGASELDRERYLLVQRNYDRRWSRAMLTPKNHKARRVDMIRELRRVLWTLRNQRSLEKAGRDFSDDLIFPSEAGTPIEMNNFAQRVFGPLLKRAGLRRIRFHDLRHTFGSLLIQTGVSLAYVRDQMGHSSIQVTVDV